MKYIPLFVLFMVLLALSCKAQIRDSIVYIPGDTITIDTAITVIIADTLNICADDTVRIVFITLPDDTTYNITFIEVPSDTICEPVIIDTTLPPPSSSRGWKVDKNANGNNDGTSWANAWESFADIDWSLVNPGDIVKISGGIDSTIYNEQFELRSLQGTADNPIIIRNSYDAGHNGRVIIDASGSGARDCIVIGDGSTAEYITIFGLELRGGRYCVWIHNAAIGIVIDSIYAYDWTSQGLKTQGDAVSSEAIKYVTIQNSDIISAKSFGGDAITFNHSSVHIIRNNFIHIRNAQQHNAHIDGLLAIRSEGFRMYNNIVILDSNAQGQAYILRAWADASNTDSVIIYNNFFYTGGVWDSDSWPWTSNFYLRYNSEANQTNPPTYVVHNTIVNWGQFYEATRWETKATFVNNIVAMYGDGTSRVVGSPTVAWMQAFRNTPTVFADSLQDNLWWREWGDGRGGGGRSKELFNGNGVTGNGITLNRFGWNDFVNKLGGTGVNANPLFIDDIGNIYGDDQANISGHLKSNSPAINKGKDVQRIIENKLGLDYVGMGDKNPDGLGVLPGTIPRDSTPDIGAYQYTE